MAIKVLFIPNSMPSHIIPLIALAKQLKDGDFECAFLLPRQYHDYVRSFGFIVLDIDKRLEDRTTPEMIAFGKFRPNVVVDDLSYTTAFATRFAKMPRISVVRRGILPFETHDAGYNHSSGVIQFLEQVSKLGLKSLGLWEPKEHADMFIGDLNLIPSIPEVEQLPDALSGNPAYLYTGNLLLSDAEMLDNLKYLKMPIDGRNIQDSRKPLDEFLERNRELKKVYFTQGLTMPVEIQRRAIACLRYLLDIGAAVITNLSNFEDFSVEQRSRIFSSSFLPMHKVCTSVDVMVHHCGSGTYNYQIQHQVPGIILGNKYYDRDENGKQLDALGAAVYIAPDWDADIYQETFDKAVSSLLNQDSELYLNQKKVLATLEQASTKTQTVFNFGQEIRKLLKM